MSAVVVEGLDQFRKELRKIDPQLGKDMGKINFDAATVILGKAISNAQSQGGSAAKGVKSMVASKKQREAVLRIGGAKNPWMPGAEFGAKRYAQFNPWRGNRWTNSPDEIGYFVHPAIESEKEEFKQVYFDAIGKLSERAFPN